MKERIDSPEVKLELLKEPWNPSTDTLPSVVPPHGLSVERQFTTKFGLSVAKKTKIPSVRCHQLQSQEEVDEVLRTLKT